MTRTSLPRRLMKLLALLLSACGGTTTTVANKPFNVEFRATSDDGESVEGAAFTTGGAHLGTSNAAGTVTTNVRGFDGQNLPVSVRCPERYVSPEQPAMLRLAEVRKVNTAAPSTLGVDVVCTRKLRDVVIVVRTGNAPSLPVDVGGKTVGTTDERGNAHLWLQVDRDARSLSVSLGTSAAPALRPQNPTRVFELDGRDALVLLDQTFSVDRRTPAVRRSPSGAPAKKHVPYRIGSGR